MKVVLTYGTFDLLHIGHIRLFKRLRALGDKLIVGVSTNKFNEIKNKNCYQSYEERFEIISMIKGVDLVIPEESWSQKVSDIKKYNVSIFGMGDDWAGKFDDLKIHCEVVYFPRTPNISSTLLRTST